MKSEAEDFAGITQSISYLPHFLSWVIVIGLMQRVLAPETGLLNEAIRFFGGDGSTFFMMESKFFYPSCLEAIFGKV